MEPSSEKKLPVISRLITEMFEMRRVDSWILTYQQKLHPAFGTSPNKTPYNRTESTCNTLRMTQSLYYWQSLPII